MFRTFARKFLPNRLDWMLKRAAKRRHKNVLLCWNRGLGDIALGIAAIVHRIRQYLPESAIRVLTRENLKDGFSMLEGVDAIIDPDWKRGEPTDWKRSLRKLKIDPKRFDLVIEKPSPTDWCPWQHNAFMPRLAWNPKHEELYKSFGLADDLIYIGVQIEAETNYGFWRNWPRFQELFDLLEKRGNVRILLFGYGTKQLFSHPCIIDLRGKTTLFQLLSIVKHRCAAMILPDSGILSMIYYLDASFPIRIVSLWGDPKHGILKQGVPSPNDQLVHIPLIGQHRDLSTVSAETVLKALFPPKPQSPLRACAKAEEVEGRRVEKAACVILAGGQGSRLGMKGPKGLFPLSNKTLFQHLLDKIPASIPIAIMTSPMNHEETVEYFRRHDSFGKTIHFFPQETISLLDEQFHPIGMGPNGNGSFYRSICSSKVLDRLEEAGIETLFVVPIENPLADPVDPKLFAHHRNQDVTIKCIERKKNESMGALSEQNGKIGIVEYFEIEQDDFVYSYMGSVALSTRFVRKAADLELPYHWVRKKVWAYGKELWIWKRERLLFDAFSAADQISALCYPRELCYAPIKGPEHKTAVENLLRQRRV